MATPHHLTLLPRSRLLVTGHPQLGYDIGTLTSVGVLATALPAARATGDAYSVAMSALGGERGGVRCGSAMGQCDGAVLRVLGAGELLADTAVHTTPHQIASDQA